MAKHSRKGSKRKGNKGGHVPIEVLEKRLKKLHNIVDARGGKLPPGYVQ